MNIVILGPAGSGKGTIAKQLAAKGNLAIFDTGSVLRKWAQDNDLNLANRLAEGGMAPTDLVIQLLSQSLASKPVGADGWIIDGTPRKADQATEIVRRKREMGFNVEAVLVLECKAAVCSERLSGRVNCERCGSLYNTKIAAFAPPSPTRCQAECGGNLITREDDRPEGIEKRLNLYKERTLPAIAILEEAGLNVVRVDSSASLETVVKRVDEVLAKSLGGQAPGWLRWKISPRARSNH